MGKGTTDRRASLAVVAAVLAAGGALLAGAGTAAAEPAPNASSGPKGPKGANGEGLEAIIRRTDHGIPHILADDFAGLGFGYGYAFAEDNLCTPSLSLIPSVVRRSSGVRSWPAIASARGYGTTIQPAGKSVASTPPAADTSSTRPPDWAWPNPVRYNREADRDALQRRRG